MHDASGIWLLRSNRKQRMRQDLLNKLLHDVHDVEMMMRRDHLSSIHNQTLRLFLHVVEEEVVSQVEEEAVGMVEEEVHYCVCPDI